MASVNVDHGKARTILNAAWERAEEDTVVAPAAMVPHLERIINASDVTFKYILITGLLAKCTNEAAHPRALQVSSDLERSHDARSLCHDVVVGFEKTKGDLWGLSNEPFLNKPARHPQHDKSNRQIRNKMLSAVLHDTLEFAHRAKKDQVFAMLVHALRLSKVGAATQVTASAEAETSHHRVVSFVRTFLEESNGGARLVAIVGAFVRLLNEGFVVKVYPPTYSDRYAKTAGDIELRQEETVVSAYECKQRPATLDDIRHGIKKARAARVREYCFVFTAGYAPGQEGPIRQEILQTEGIDALLVDMLAVAPDWATTLNPIRRARFGETVVAILREEMRRTRIANQAGELWNSL